MQLFPEIPQQAAASPRRGVRRWPRRSRGRLLVLRLAEQPPGRLRADAARALQPQAPRRPDGHGLPVLPRQRRAGRARADPRDAGVHGLPRAREDRQRAPRARPRELGERQADRVGQGPQAPGPRLLRPQRPPGGRRRLRHLPRPHRPDGRRPPEPADRMQWCLECHRNPTPNLRPKDRDHEHDVDARGCAGRAGLRRQSTPPSTAPGATDEQASAVRARQDGRQRAGLLAEPREPRERARAARSGRVPAPARRSGHREDGRGRRPARRRHARPSEPPQARRHCGGCVHAAACVRRPVEKLVPYTRQVEYSVPGVAYHYASARVERGDVVGLLAEVHENRPTKLEGNPDHPANRGTTDLRTQASILDLYDPDRPGTMSRRDGDHRVDANAGELDRVLAEVVAHSSADQGARLRLLVEPSISPTFLRFRDAFKAKFPQAKVYAWTALDHTSVREGSRLAFGQLLERCLRLLDGPHHPRARQRLPPDGARHAPRDARLRPRPASAQAAGGHEPPVRRGARLHDDRLERGQPAPPAGPRHRGVPARARQGARHEARPHGRPQRLRGRGHGDPRGRLAAMARRPSRRTSSRTAAGRSSSSARASPRASTRSSTPSTPRSATTARASTSTRSPTRTRGTPSPTSSSSRRSSTAARSTRSSSSAATPPTMRRRPRLRREDWQGEGPRCGSALTSTRPPCGPPGTSREPTSSRPGATRGVSTGPCR